MEGNTTIKNEVMVKIAVGAASEVSGVDQVGASSVGRTIVHAFGGGKTSRSGVGVTPGQPGSGEASFSMTLSTEYGFSIPDIANLVREAVASRIKDITGLNVRRVDIHVEDIREPRGDGTASRVSYIGAGESSTFIEEKARFAEIPKS